MSNKKVYSKPGLFGKTILYNDKGQVIGSGTPISSKTTVYTDTSGNYMGKSYSGSGSSSNLVGADGSVAKGRSGYPGGVTKYVGKDEKPVSSGSGSTETETAKSGGLFSFWRKTPQAKPVPEPDFIKAENYDLSKTPQGWFISKYTGADVQQLSIPGVIAGKPIVGINENAFYGRDALEDVLVPDGVPHLDYTIFDQCRRVHIHCRPASAAHLLLRRTRIKHSLLVSWPETEK